MEVKKEDAIESIERIRESDLKSYNDWSSIKILDLYYEQRKENKELKEKIEGMVDNNNKLIEVTNLYLDSIPKSLVREKIEEVKKSKENVLKYSNEKNSKIFQIQVKQICEGQTQVLQELLGK